MILIAPNYWATFLYYNFGVFREFPLAGTSYRQNSFVRLACTGNSLDSMLNGRDLEVILMCAQKSKNADISINFVE